MKDILYLIAGLGAWLYIAFWFLQRAGDDQLNLFIGGAAIMFLFATLIGILQVALFGEDRGKGRGK